MENVIRAVIEFIVGIGMLPAAAAYVVYVTADPNLSSIVGLSIAISIGLMVIAFGLIYHTAMQFFGKK